MSHPAAYIVNEHCLKYLFAFIVRAKPLTYVSAASATSFFSRYISFTARIWYFGGVFELLL